MLPVWKVAGCYLYAKRRYYEGPLKGIKGPYWVERMLPTSLPQILNAVKGEIKKI